MGAKFTYKRKSRSLLDSSLAQGYSPFGAQSNRMLRTGLTTIMWGKEKRDCLSSLMWTCHGINKPISRTIYERRMRGKYLVLALCYSGSLASVEVKVESLSPPCSYDWWMGFGLCVCVLGHDDGRDGIPASSLDRHGSERRVYGGKMEWNRKNKNKIESINFLSATLVGMAPKCYATAKRKAWSKMELELARELDVSFPHLLLRAAFLPWSACIIVLARDLREECVF